MAWVYMLYALAIILIVIGIVFITFSFKLDRVKGFKKLKKLKGRLFRRAKLITWGISLGCIVIAMVCFVLANSISGMMQQITAASTVQAIFGKDSSCTCYVKCTGDAEEDDKTSYELLFGSAAFQELMTYVPSSNEDGASYASCQTIRDKSIYIRNNINDDMVDCYKKALEERPDIRDDGVDRLKLSDSALKNDLKKLFSDYKQDGKNHNCGCKEHTVRLLKRKCLGGEPFGGEWSWKRIEEEISDWFNPSDTEGEDGFIPGNATGQYAIELNDGSYYWYHQSTACSNCTYCGNWSKLRWGNPVGTDMLGDNGCAVYALAMVASNLKGAEITPSEILKTLDSEISDGNCKTSSTYFSNRMIRRDKAVEKVANTYGLKVQAIPTTEDAIDEILNKGGYVWGSWHGPFEWYSGDGHFMAIRKGTSDSYYCFTSCRNSALGVGGKDGAILTMNTPSSKSTVISYANSGQFYGFWVDKPVNENPESGGGTFGDPTTNTNVYNILMNSGYSNKAYAMAAAYGATSGVYGHNFAVGLMANIYHEGAPGQIEGDWGSSYWDDPRVSDAVRALNYKVITNVSMVNTMLTVPGDLKGIGIGSIQWSGGRRVGILNLYKSRASTYSADELGAIEVEYMLQELAGSYAGVPSKCSGKSASDCASIICKDYESPANENQQAVIRAETARKLEALLQ